MKNKNKQDAKEKKKDLKRCNERRKNSAKN